MGQFDSVSPDFDEGVGGVGFFSVLPFYVFCFVVIGVGSSVAERVPVKHLRAGSSPAQPSFEWMIGILGIGP